jgi:hypothetical protein
MPLAPAPRHDLGLNDAESSTFPIVPGSQHAERYAVRANLDARGACEDHRREPGKKISPSFALIEE